MWPFSAVYGENGISRWLNKDIVYPLAGRTTLVMGGYDEQEMGEWEGGRGERERMREGEGVR